MTKVTEIPVYCWECGKRFYIDINNVYAGRLFCSDDCRIKNLKQEAEINNKMERGNKAKRR